MAHLIRTLRGEYAKRGYSMRWNDGHVTVAREGRTVCEMDMTGMDEATLRSNIELLIIAITQ